MEAAREATAADLPALATLARMARVDSLPKRGGEVLDRLDEYRNDLAGRLVEAHEDPEVVLAAGTIDAVPVAYAIMRVTCVADGRMHAVVEELFVEPEARAVGVGEAILAMLISVAVERGAVGIESLALPWDRATKTFFETQGMVGRGLLVRRWLDGR